MNPLKWLFGKNDKRTNGNVSVIDVGENDFVTQVIQRSHKQTVMVDFWAAWCNPCRILGPVLEDLAAEETSGFLLAKLDTEENARLASQYQIRSIPAIKVFRNGQVVGEFAGLMPAHKIRALVQDINEKPAPAPRLKVPVVSGQRLKQARQHLKKGRGFEAYVLLRDFAGDESEEAAALMPLARFLMDIRDGDWPSGNGTLDELYVNAADALSKGKPEEMVERLEAALDLGDPAPVTSTRNVLAALFTLLGDEHPLTREYRVEPRPA